MKYKLVYLNNVYRETLCCFECDNEPYTTARKLLDEFGHPYNEGRGRFFTHVEKDFITISYSEIIAVNNAVGLFCRNGYVFDIRTGENNHLHTPHVHVSWADGGISVRLDNYSIERRNGTKPHEERKAVKIIKKYESYFIDAWDEIINNHDTQKAKEIFDNLK